MKNKIFITLIALAIGVTAWAQTAADTLVPYRSGDKWGFSTTDKRIVISPAYQEVGWFSEGFAAVKKGNKYGYINRAGKMVIPAKFTVAKPFRKGYMPHKGKEGGDSLIFAGASIRTDGYEICINTKGVRMPQCPAINENSAAENKTPLETTVLKKTYNLANNNGMFDKITNDYTIQGSDETYYIAVKDNRYGVFNSKFDTIVPFEYTDIKYNGNKNAPFLQVNKGGMFGVLLPNGKTSIEPVFANLTAVDGSDGNEYIILQKNGKTFVKDVNNRDIISSGFNAIEYDKTGFITTGDNNLKGYYFTDARVIQPRYKEVQHIAGTRYLMVKTTSDKTGYINAMGEEYFSE